VQLCRDGLHKVVPPKNKTYSPEFPNASLKSSSFLWPFSYQSEQAGVAANNNNAAINQMRIPVKI
jgi:hypothetical protein